MASMMSARPVTPPIGRPPPRPLAVVTRSGTTPKCSQENNFAGPCHAGLHLVGDEDDPVLLAVLREAREEPVAGDDHPALALHRLDEQARDAVGSDLLVHRGDRQVRAGLAAPLGRRAGRATVGVAEGHAVDLGGKRPEARLVGHRLGRERHREQGPAVEGMVEHDDGLTAGEGPGDLDGVLDGLGARVDEEAAFLGRTRARGR